MEDKKLPEFLKNIPKLDPDVLKGIINNPPRVNDYINQFNNFNPNEKVINQISESNKKKATRETIVFWIGISSFVLAIASIVISIIALNH